LGGEKSVSHLYCQSFSKRFGSSISAKATSASYKQNYVNLSPLTLLPDMSKN
jgi:hypothetical protein